MARRHGLIAALAALAFAPAAQAAPSYPLYGLGPELLRPGVLAAEASIRAMPIALAARPDGTVAFAADGVVHALRDGRLVTVPAPISTGLALAYAPDGDLLVAACSEVAGGRILRAAPDRAPVVIAGRANRLRSTGDGGPATAAGFVCPTGVDVDAGGGILVADPAAGRVRRIAPDGIVRTVAGTRAPKREPRPGERGSGDGGFATAAVLLAPHDVAALPGGGFAVLDGARVRIVGADGRISGSNTPRAIAIAPHPDGLLIVGTEGHVWRRATDGSMIAVTELRRESLGMERAIPVAGDPFGSGPAIVGDAITAPDGGVLVSADFGVHYVPPAVPRRLALALRHATRRPAPSLTVQLTTTLPAQVRIGVWRDGKRAAFVTASVPGGDAAVPIPAVRASGVYTVHAQAADHDEVVAASAAVLVGTRLPLDYARDFIRSRFDLFEILYDTEHVDLRCRRMAAGRIDCATRAGGRCRGIAGLRREDDGTLATLAYDGCRFSFERGEPAERRGLPDGTTKRVVLRR